MFHADWQLCMVNYQSLILLLTSTILRCARIASIPDSSVYPAITLPTSDSDFVSVRTERRRMYLLYA